MSEKSEVGVRPVSLEEFDRFVNGEQNMDGARYDLDTRGITSDDPTMRQAIYPTPPEQPVYQEQQQPQNWQALYGREANEKGQWRRTAEEAIAQLEALKAQQTLQAPTYQAPVVGNVTQLTQTQAPIPERLFPDRDLNDAVLVEDVEAMLKNMVAPEIWNLRNQATTLQHLQVQTAKANAGISPALEAQLVNSHPWLNNITDPFARITAMRDQLAQAQAVQRVQQPAPSQPAPQQQGGNIATRRLTMIENTNPRVADADMDTQALFGQDMAEAMRMPFGEERTKAMREVFGKYGIFNQNDWGPGVLPR